METVVLLVILIIVVAFMGWYVFKTARGNDPQKEFLGFQAREDGKRSQCDDLRKLREQYDFQMRRAKTYKDSPEEGARCERTRQLIIEIRNANDAGHSHSLPADYSVIGIPRFHRS